MAFAPNRSPVLPCVDHGLPYQVIFEEHRSRRPWDLLFATLEAVPEFSAADVTDTRWNDLVNQRNDAISKLNESRKNLDELEAQLGEKNPDVQNQRADWNKGGIISSALHWITHCRHEVAVNEVRKEVAELERAARICHKRIWRTFSTPLKAPRWAVMRTKFELEALWRQLTALRILRADLNAKELKGIDLTTLFKHLDRRSVHLTIDSIVCGAS